MSDETKMMSAVFCHERLVTAAVWLAARNYRPILQFRRAGDRLEVMGSNGYILVRGEIDAEFTGWDDGAAVRLDQDVSVYALLKTLEAFDVDEMPHELEVTGSFASYRIDGISAQSEVLLGPVSAKPIDLERFIGLASEDPEGGSLMSSANLRIMAKLTKKAGLRHSSWHVEPHGKNKAMALRLEPEYNRNDIIIMAMPVHED